MSKIANEYARDQKRKAMFGAFLGLTSGYTSAYAATTTVFILPLTDEFGWGRTIPSLMYLSASAGIALASIWLGGIIRRFGPGPVAAFGGIGLSIVILALSMQQGAAWFAIALGFLAGFFGAGTGSGLYLSVLPDWFEEDLGRALGLSVVGQSAGMAIMPALATAALQSVDWRAAYLTLAIVQLLATCLAAIMLFRLYQENPTANTRNRSEARAGCTVGEAIRLPSFWILGGSVFLTCAGVIGTAIHMFPIYSDRQIDPDWLAYTALALGGGTFVGRITTGFLLDHIDARMVAMYTYVIGAAGIVWLFVASPTLSMLEMLGPPLLVGTALGAESDILAYLACRIFGQLHFPIIYNRLLIAFYMGSVAGTVFLGWAADTFIDYDMALLAMAGSCLLAALLVQALPRISHLR